MSSNWLRRTAATLRDPFTRIWRGRRRDDDSSGRWTVEEGFQHRALTRAEILEERATHEPRARAWLDRARRAKW